jgi:hypothetical protein
MPGAGRSLQETVQMQTIDATKTIRPGVCIEDTLVTKILFPRFITGIETVP